MRNHKLGKPQTVKQKHSRLPPRSRLVSSFFHSLYWSWSDLQEKGDNSIWTQRNTDLLPIKVAHLCFAPIPNCLFFSHHFGGDLCKRANWKSRTSTLHHATSSIYRCCIWCRRIIFFALQTQSQRTSEHRQGMLGALAYSLAISKATRFTFRTDHGCKVITSRRARKNEWFFALQFPHTLVHPCQNIFLGVTYQSACQMQSTTQSRAPASDPCNIILFKDKKNSCLSLSAAANWL